MTERAVKRNPRLPDFEGLSVYLAHTLDETGGVVTTAFDKHIADIKKDAALVLKQERLWREEQAGERKRGGGDSPQKDQKGKPDGGGKKGAGKDDGKKAPGGQPQAAVP